MADDGDSNDDNVFIYMGGSIPQHLRDTITHVRIHKSVKIIPARAFQDCQNLVSIEMHDGVEIIEESAIYRCTSLRNIKLTSVRVIEDWAFAGCASLVDVEFGDKLESIGEWALAYTSLANVKIPKVRTIGNRAFYKCEKLTEVALSEDFETTIGYEAFGCRRLRRIAIPLKANLLVGNVFDDCDNLLAVDLVGGIHKTVSSLLLQSWRNEMKNVINEINYLLPSTTTDEKTTVIRHWIERVIRRIEHYKSEHYALLKEFTTLLELALWKVKLDEEFVEALIKEDNESNTVKKAKIDMKAARQEQRITSGANIVIKNVLPFLKLE